MVRRTGRSRVRQIRLPHELDARVDELATQRGTTVSALIREALIARFFVPVNGDGFAIREAVSA